MTMSTSTPSFLVGTAISVYQNSGGTDTNWSEFELKRTGNGKPTIKGGVSCGEGANFWELYEEDIERAASLKLNSFRLSIEWNRIEPKRGKTDEAGIARYHQIFDCLHRHKLEPMVTLHHFVHPNWFEDLGGFTREANIPIFVEFARTAFRHFGSKVKLWATFNEPGVMGFCGWIYGTFPPAKTIQWATAGRHMCNMLRAHTAAYRAIKAMPGGQEVQVGLVHNYMNYEPYTNTWAAKWYLQPVCNTMQYIWGTDILLKYFQTGKFLWQAPVGGRVEFDEGSKPGLDFIGMNYYGRVRIDWKFATLCKPGETMGDMPFALYGPDMYQGIKTLSSLQVPVYVTETGIPDRSGNKRAKFFDAYIPQIEKAIKEGIDVRGMFYWTLIDNFEWAEGYDIRFGLYEWNPDSTQKRIFRGDFDVAVKAFSSMHTLMASAVKARNST